MELLKSFVIGSSFIVCLPFFYAVLYHAPNKRYSYENYTLFAPIGLGIWNMISLILAEYLGLTPRQRFALISVISSMSTMLMSTLFKTYNFTEKEWKKYYLSIFIKYLIVWNIIIYNIDKYI